MEQIKDMATLRAFALDKAIQTFYDGTVTSHFKEMVLERAKDIESYILGGAKLPEAYEDKSTELFKDVMAKINQPIQSLTWTPVSVKPTDNEWKLCALKYGPHIEYEVMQYDIYDAKWYGIDDDNTNHVVAWLPIPKYEQTL